MQREGEVQASTLPLSNRARVPHSSIVLKISSMLTLTGLESQQEGSKSVCESSFNDMTPDHWFLMPRPGRGVETRWRRQKEAPKDLLNITTVSLA